MEMNIGELLKYKNNKIRLDVIKKNRNDIVPFVGAGVSISCGLCSWAELLDKLAEDYFTKTEIKSLKTGMNVFTYADIIVETAKNEHIVMKRIGEIFSKSDIVINPTAIMLVNDFSNLVITTNYDKILEIASIKQEKKPPLLPLLPCLEAQAYDAIQLNKRCLLKLHGSIEETSSMIIDSKQYNKFYGNGESNNLNNKILPSLLMQLFAGRKMLFVGCSLEEDRILDILATCKESHEKITHYAILPFFKNKKKQLRRNRFLSNLGIEPIFYPEGDYSAVEKLLIYITENRNDFLITNEYINSYKFFGRKREILFLKDSMTNNYYTPILVWGEAGNGKTATVREFYCQMKFENPEFEMPFIGLSQIDTLENFYSKIQYALTGSVQPKMQISDIIKLIIKRSHKLFCLYFDNWEDIWNSSYEFTHLVLIQLLTELQANHIHVIISSRVAIDGIDILVCNIKKLPKTNAKQLFLHIYGHKTVPKGQSDIFNKLLNSLDGHALSIVLVAVQAKHLPQLRMVYEQWYKIEDEMENTRHKGIYTALRMTWNQIFHNYNATVLWGMISIFNGNIPVFFMDYLQDKEYDLNNALRLLHENAVITYEKSEISMLLPLKEQWELLDSDRLLTNECYTRYLNLFAKISSIINNPQNNQQLNNALINYWFSIFSLLQKIQAKSNDSKLVKVCAQFHNFYKYNPQNALPFLESLPYSPEQDLYFAVIYENMGKLYYLFSQYDYANKYYQKAEKIYKKNNNLLGMVYIIKNRGDVIFDKGLYERALSLYRDAETIVNNEGLDKKDNLILPNILKGQAHSLREIGKKEPEKSSYFEKAILLYDRCENLYNNAQSLAGLANTYKGKGDLYKFLNCSSDAIEMYEEALKIFKKTREPSGLGNTCAELLIEYNKEGKNLKRLKQYILEIYSFIPYKKVQEKIRDSWFVVFDEKIPL